MHIFSYNFQGTVVNEVSLVGAGTTMLVMENQAFTHVCARILTTVDAFNVTATVMTNASGKAVGKCLAISLKV